MSSEERWCIIFDTLRDQSRRRVLTSLRDAEARTMGEILDEVERVDGRDRRALRIAFVHIHLPTLHDTGYIDWRREADKIRRGPNFEEIYPVLDVLDENRDRLPDGWL
jgi:hypothetical protein